MRIGIDARGLSRQRTGLENFAVGLIRELPQLRPDYSFFLYSNRQMNTKLPDAQLRSVVEDAWRFVPSSFWMRARGRALARRDALNVFWSPYPIISSGIPKNVLKIITVHDIVWLKYPETTSNFNWLIQKLWTSKSIAEADRIIVSSQSTQKDLTDILGVAPEKLRLIPCGVSEHFAPTSQEDSARFISSKYQVPSRYIAALGSIEPRKNLTTLVEAIRLMKVRNALECPLLIAGGKGWKNSALFEQIRSAGLSESDVRFLGYMPEEDLPRFYSGARLFVFPSLYEGFGIPPLEAMSCGTPVLASNAQCMPEILGDAAVLIPPTSAEGFATSISRLLSDQTRLEALRQSGILHAKKYRWKESAMRLADLFDEARN